MPCLKVINWLGRTDKKLSNCKRALPYNQCISHYNNQMKHHSFKDVTVSLYPYSFDLLRRGGETLWREVCVISIGWYLDTSKRWRTIATYALWSSYRKPLRDTESIILYHEPRMTELGRCVEWRGLDFGRFVLGIVSTSGLLDNL